MVSYRNLGQNYKKNNKIHEEVSQNQVNSNGIDTILSIYLTIIDKHGHDISGATITIGDLEIISSRKGNLIKNFPNEEVTITVSKEGYKTATATLIVDATRQGHGFVLEEESSSDDSSVVSWPSDASQSEEEPPVEPPVEPPAEPPVEEPSEPQSDSVGFIALDYDTGEKISNVTFTVNGETKTSVGDETVYFDLTNDLFTIKIEKEGYQTIEEEESSITGGKRISTYQRTLQKA